MTKVPGRRNADRHIQRWNLLRPNGTEAQHIFRVWIPESELRQTSVVEDLRAVRWLPAPPAGQMIILECYVTPPSRNDPTFSSNLPYSLLASCRSQTAVGLLCSIVSNRATSGGWNTLGHK